MKIEPSPTALRLYRLRRAYRTLLVLGAVMLLGAAAAFLFISVVAATSAALAGLILWLVAFDVLLPKPALIDEVTDTSIVLKHRAGMRTIPLARIRDFALGPFGAPRRLRNMIIRLADSNERFIVPDEPSYDLAGLLRAAGVKQRVA